MSVCCTEVVLGVVLQFTFFSEGTSAVILRSELWDLDFVEVVKIVEELPDFDALLFVVLMYCRELQVLFVWWL